MKRIYFMAAMVAALLNFDACKKTNADKPVPAPEVKEFMVSVGMKDYSNWTYVNLKTGETETHRDFSAWNYYKIGQGGKKELDRTEPAKGSLADVKIEWHIAIHPKAIRTNNTEAALSDSKDLKNATVPASDKFMKDGKLKDMLWTDLSGMMSGKPIGVAAVAYGNDLLTKWLKKTPVEGEHGKYTYELNEKIFFVRCKDGSLVKVKFTDYRNAEGQQGFCKFQSLPVVQK